MLEALREYIEHRLEILQRARNFNPSLGAEQVKDFPGLQREYGMFEELKRMVDRFELPIQISYDSVAHITKETCVYFDQKEGTTEWKIGYTTNVHKRTCALNTGSSGTLVNRHRLSGGRDLEQSIHRYLDSYRIKGRSKEWFSLDHKVIKALIQRIKLEGTGFLPST